MRTWSSPRWPVTGPSLSPPPRYQSCSSRSRGLSGCGSRKIFTARPGSRSDANASRQALIGTTLVVRARTSISPRASSRSAAANSRRTPGRARRCPRTSRAWPGRAGRLPHRADEIGVVGLDQLDRDRFLGLEVVVQAAGQDAGRRRHLAHRPVRVPLGREELGGPREDLVAPAHPAGHGRPGGLTMGTRPPGHYRPARCLADQPARASPAVSWETARTRAASRPSPAAIHSGHVGHITLRVRAGISPAWARRPRPARARARAWGGLAGPPRARSRRPAGSSPPRTAA